VDGRIFGGEPGQGDTEFERGLKSADVAPRIGKHESVWHDHGVSINVCTSAKKVGASPAIGLLSSPSLEKPLEQARLQGATLMLA